MISVRTLITDAFEASGIYAPTEVPTAGEINQALRIYNQTIEAWSVEGMLTYTDHVIEHEVVSNHESLSIGKIAADIDAQRPPRIKDMYFRISTGPNPLDYFMREIDSRQYDSVAMKNLEGMYPQFYYYKPNFPNGEIFFYPKLSYQGTLFIRFDEYLQTAETLDDGIRFPPGYEIALTYTIANQLVHFYGLVRPDIAEMAEKYSDILRKNNVVIGTLSPDPLAPSFGSNSNASGAVGNFYHGQLGF